MLSRRPSTFSVTAFAVSLRDASNSVSSLSTGSCPPKYFSIMPAVLETRFPRSLARSELILWIRASFVKFPSCPKAISLRRK